MVSRLVECEERTCAVETAIRLQRIAESEKYSSPAVRHGKVPLFRTSRSRFSGTPDAVLYILYRPGTRLSCWTLCQCQRKRASINSLPSAATQPSRPNSARERAVSQRTAQGSSRIRGALPRTYSEYRAYPLCFGLAPRAPLRWHGGVSADSAPHRQHSSQRSKGADEIGRDRYRGPVYMLLRALRRATSL